MIQSSSRSNTTSLELNEPQEHTRGHTTGHTTGQPAAVHGNAGARYGEFNRKRKVDY
jgi:hypothetical protein